MNKDIRRTFANIPTLETDRLTLRKIRVTDCEDMYEYACQPEVTKYLLWQPHSDSRYTREYLERLQTQYRNGEFYDWAVVIRESCESGWGVFRHESVRETMIGTCGFTSLWPEDNRGEIGYVLNPKYWGKGIMSEAVARVLAFGFSELGLNRIEARYMVGNERSLGLMQRCGMTFEGVHRELMLVKGIYRDIGTCAILARDFFDKQNQSVSP